MGVLTFAAISWVVRTMYRRLDQAGIFDTNTVSAHGTIAWIEGLRGISALGTVASHLTACLAPYMRDSCCESPNSDHASIFQLPPLRILAAEHPWMAMFFLISGFVSASEPVTLAQMGALEDAYLNVRRAALKRPLRFMLPATLMTCISWLVCHLGGFVAARRVGRSLLSTRAPAASNSILWAVADLFLATLTTWWWSVPHNPYEPMQWPLVYMLQGSYMLYIALWITLRLSTRVRTLAVSIMLFLSFWLTTKLQDPLVGPAYLTGLLLAQLWHSKLRDWLQPVALVLSPALATGGVVCMSWAKSKGRPLNWKDRQLKWTDHVRSYVVSYLPAVHDVERLIGLVGVALVVLAVIISPRFQKYLSTRPMLWLGKISFAIYFVHMTVIRVCMPWLLYISNPIKGLFLLRTGSAESFKSVVVAPTIFRQVLGVFLLFLLLLTAAHQWMRHVEPRIERVSDGFEYYATGKSPPAKRALCSKRENGRLPMYHDSRIE